MPKSQEDVTLDKQTLKNQSPEEQSLRKRSAEQSHPEKKGQERPSTRQIPDGLSDRERGQRQITKIDG